MTAHLKQKKHHAVLINHIRFVIDTILTNNFYTSILSFNRYKSEYHNTLSLIHAFKVRLPKELVMKSRECQLRIIEIENRIYVKNTLETVKEQKVEMSSNG